MVAMKVRTKLETRKVLNAAKKGSLESLGRAGAYLRGIAMRSIKVSPDPAPPGHPPHTRKGRLKKGIFYAVERERQAALVGPTATEVGRIGHTHEFGGTEPPKARKGRRNNWRLAVGGQGPIAVENGKPVVVPLRTERQVARAKEVAAGLPASQGGQARDKVRVYPARPFMGPALEIAKARLPQCWANSVKGD